ncbi:MAG: DUF4458 domain-containing protein, partial [Tyzzerella sp.]|nr:DUF4458 domain-containing protein [Tyzzerella sp.]
MNDKQLRFKAYIIPLIISVWMLCGITGCSDDNEEIQQNQYGYVQFKLLKSASYNSGTEARATNKLNLLNDAKKVEVILQHDGSTISQTLVLNAYNEVNAEFGLRSDKLQLLIGDYTISGFRLYDNLDALLLTGETEDNTFTIVGGGLTNKTLPIETVEKGMASFKLVKEFIKARATDDSAYPFSNIQLVDIAVKNTFTK